MLTSTYSSRDLISIHLLVVCTLYTKGSRSTTPSIPRQSLVPQIPTWMAIVKGSVEESEVIINNGKRP